MDCKKINLAVWGITFKPGTDDIRESQAVKIIDILLRNGFKIHIFDPKGLKNAKQYYSFIAVRNSKYLQTLYSDKRFIKLKFFQGHKVVGWSISLCTKLKDHKQFGSMQLGSIIDCLSLKGYETTIISKTSEILKKIGAHLIVSNQSHIFWKSAFKMNSFIKGPSNFIFASSKALSDKLIGNTKSNEYIHLTRGDGDGPINL